VLFEASKMLEPRLFGFEAIVCQCSGGVKKCLASRETGQVKFQEFKWTITPVVSMGRCNTYIAMKTKAKDAR
jgi:hypothetical protein